MKTSAILLFTLVVQTCFSQAPIKFGKPEMSDLQMTVYENDSSAPAVVLCDYGISKIDHIGEEFQVIFQRILRIKILKKEGLDWADHIIDLYTPDDGKPDKVGSLKGWTYNLVNGKIEKTKLESSSEFDVKVNEYWSEKKIAFPKVTVGSVLDLSYTVTLPRYSDYPSWYFQKSIPVVHSEYRARFIEYFEFKKLLQGYIPLTVNTQDPSQQRYSINRTQGAGWNRAPDGSIGRRALPSRTNYTANAVDHRWVIKNVPAFKIEDHMSSVENFVSKIDFQLVGTKWPDEGFRNRLGDWETINRRLVEGDFFYSKINGSNFLKKEIEKVSAQSKFSHDLDKIQALRDHIEHNVRWNRHYTITTDRLLKKVFEEGSGTIAEINLMLTSILQKAGYEAAPVLISTRSHGYVKEQFPLVDQFNYVITVVRLDGREYLIDATEKYLPVGVLPKRCLNGPGLIIDPKGPSWIEITPIVKNKTQIAISAEFQEERVVAQVLHKFEGYDAFAVRSQFFRDSTEFKSRWISNYLWNGDVKNFADFNTPSPSIKSTIYLDEEVKGDVIYITAFLSQFWQENPFKEEKRFYPVEFEAPISRTYYFTLEVPSGYKVDELPPNVNLSLPERGGNLRLTSSSQDSKITVLCKLELDQTFFGPEDYKTIKTFFDNIMAQQESVIVLKKT